MAGGRAGENPGEPFGEHVVTALIVAEPVERGEQHRDVLLVAMCGEQVRGRRGTVGDPGRRGDLGAECAKHAEQARRACGCQPADEGENLRYRSSPVPDPPEYQIEGADVGARVVQECQQLCVGGGGQVTAVSVGRCGGVEDHVQAPVAAAPASPRLFVGPQFGRICGVDAPGGGLPQVTTRRATGREGRPGRRASDTRWDWQVDDRCTYLARLLRDLRLDLAPLVAQLRACGPYLGLQPDPTDDNNQFNLAVGILAALSRAGEEQPREALRGYVRDGVRRLVHS